MATAEQSITPEEIRSIRESLRLSQIEAGDVVGGGPNAFAKYEAGTVKPSAAVIKLLRLLEARPELISDLGGEAPRPAASAATSPFAVTGENISELDQGKFTNLLRLLLTAEALAYNLPADGIHVASNANTPDGGEDGRITWRGGRWRTPFLPSRLNQFQLKSSAVAPARAGQDVLTRHGSVKDMIHSVLVEGGNYIMLCAHSYTGKQIEDRKAKIREAIRSAGIPTDDCQVDFRDSDQIATWVNDHPSVAMWVREQVRPGGIGPFRTWGHWSRRPQHQRSPWVEDERLPELSARLHELTKEGRKVVRVVGLSGIGKSRLVLESLSRRWYRDLVMYAVESESSSEALCGAVQILADSGRPAIVVVDDCGPDTHRMLASMVLRLGSRLSLVTIDNQVSTSTFDDTIIEVREAPTPVIEAIIDRVSLGLHSEDRRRLVHFAGGFPEIASRVGRAWTMGLPISQTADGLVDTYVVGGQPSESTVLLKSAKLMATFGLLAVEPADNRQLEEVASLGRDLSADDLHAAVVDLVERGVVQRRGRLAILQPRPVAMWLSERQWKEWTKNRWDDVLSGHVSFDLRKGAARQLAMLNSTEIAHDVVNHVCRLDGPFDQSQWILQTGQAEVLSSLAEVDPETVAAQVERSLQDIPDLSMIGGHSRGHLIEALEKIAFHSDTFEEGALILLRLAAAEQASWTNENSERLNSIPVGRKASEQFCALFPVLLGKTEADGHKRLAFLDGVAYAGEPAQKVVVVQALIAGTELRHFSRIVGVEIQGSRPVLDSWHPKTDAGLTSYVNGCVKLLAKIAVQDDCAGIMARDGLSSMLSSLILEGFIDTVETVVLDVAASVDYWPSAMRRLGSMLALDAERIGPGEFDRVRALVETLQPKCLESATLAVITEGLWGNIWDPQLDIETREQRKRSAVRDLVAELLNEPTILMSLLPQLSRGRQFMARELGEALANSSEAPTEWLEPIIQAIVEAPEGERNCDLLSGFVASLADTQPDTAEAFKPRAARSRELAPVFPRLCLRMGINADDILLAIDALQNGLLRPRDLNRWAIRGVFANVPAAAVATLLDALTDHSAESFAEAILLLGVHCSDGTNKFECFLPQIIKIAENTSRWDPNVIRDTQDPWGDPAMVHYYFEKCISYILDKGPDNAGAREMALALATTLANGDDRHDSLLTKLVLSRLLTDFAEIAWPPIGHAIVSDPHRAGRFEFLLGDQFAIGRQPDPLILNIPEDTLFAWCHAYPDQAPAFTARVVPVLEPDQADTEDQSFRPVMTWLLDEFGERDDVQQAVGSNIHTFGWYGSMATHFTLFEKPLAKLQSHPKIKLRLWAGRMLRELRNSIDNARNQDAERLAQSEV